MEKWFNKIDWQPFLWFGCFLVLILIAILLRMLAHWLPATDSPEVKLAADLCILGAGSVAPRIRSSKPIPDMKGG